MKPLYILPVLIVLPMGAFAGYSQYSNTNSIKGYIGLNANYVRGQLNDAFGEGFSYTSGYDVDTDDLINPDNFGFSLNAGAQFNEYFGAEVFLQHTFDSTAEIDFYNTGIKVSNYKSKISSWAFGADMLGYIPISNSGFSFIGSMGLGYYKFNAKFDVKNYVYDTSLTESDDENNIALRIGIGGQYAFSERWALRGLARYVALNYDEDEDVVENLIDISLGFRYTF